MKLLAKQVKSDIVSSVPEALRMILVVPAMFFLISFVDSEIWSPERFLTMMVMLAMPAGILTISMMRLTTTIHTTLSMGSTRRAFYVSNLISSAVLFVFLTVVPLLLTGLIMLPFQSQSGMEVIKLAISPSLVGIAFCLDTLAFGVGTLTGGLVSRFGRKVFIIMLVVLILLGGVFGGLIAIASTGDSGLFLSFGNQTVALAAVGALAVGLVLYGIGWKTVKKYYVS